MARDLDFYGWAMYQLHAAARTQHNTYHPLVHEFLADSGRAGKLPMLISTHTTPPNSRLVHFTRAAPEWPLGETMTTTEKSALRAA